MLQEPLGVIAEMVMVAGYGTRPLRAALVNRELRNIICDCGHNLHRGGTGTDYRNALAGELQLIGPMYGVKHFTGVILHAVYARQGRQVELPHRADQRPGLNLLDAAGTFHPHTPATASLIPVCSDHAGIELDVWIQLQRRCSIFQVLLNFFAGRKITAPGVTRPERKGVGVIRRINATARVGVLQPGTPDICIFFDDPKGNTPLQQQHAKHNSADTRAHNQYWQIFLLRAGFYSRNTFRQAGESHLLTHHGRIFRVYPLTKAGAHHTQQLCFIRRLNGWRLPGATQ